MECGAAIFVIVLFIGIAIIGYAPDFALRALKALAHPISDAGAFASGCIVGLMSPPVVIYFTDAYVAAYSTTLDCVYLISIIILGAISGAVAGAVWSLIRDRQLKTGAKLGAIGGAITGLLAIPVWIFVAMLLFGG